MRPSSWVRFGVLLISIDSWFWLLILVVLQGSSPTTRLTIVPDVAFILSAPLLLGIYFLWHGGARVEDSVGKILTLTGLLSLISLLFAQPESYLSLVSIGIVLILGGAAIRYSSGKRP